MDYLADSVQSGQNTDIRPEVVSINQRFKKAKAEMDRPFTVGTSFMEVEKIVWQDEPDNYMEITMIGADEHTQGCRESFRNYMKGKGVEFLIKNLEALGLVSADFDEVIQDLSSLVGIKVFGHVIEKPRLDSPFPYRNVYFVQEELNEVAR
jgi:hypothetical protein